MPNVQRNPKESSKKRKLLTVRQTKKKEFKKKRIYKFFDHIENNNRKLSFIWTITFYVNLNANNNGTPLNLILTLFEKIFFFFGKY